MEIKVTAEDGRSVVSIAGDLRIGSLAGARGELVAVLATGNEIALDLGGLGGCDTAGLQFLLMACASARANGQRIATINQTAEFQAALDRIGLCAECLQAGFGEPVASQDDHEADDAAASRPMLQPQPG
jgi:anti-anti-sigma regulatory factor